MDQNPTETSVQRPRQDTSGDVKVPMTQDAMTKTVNASEVCIYSLSIVPWYQRSWVPKQDVKLCSVEVPPQ